MFHISLCGWMSAVNSVAAFLQELVTLGDFESVHLYQQYFHEHRWVSVSNYYIFLASVTKLLASCGPFELIMEPHKAMSIYSISETKKKEILKKT